MMTRQLDAAIAKALGEIVSYKDKSYASILGHKHKWLLHYSTDGNTMLELDKEMRKKGYELCELEYQTAFINRQVWKAAYRKPDHFAYDLFRAEANTEPLARALAAYYALTGKEWEVEE